VNSLKALDNVINTEQVTTKEWEVTKEGSSMIENGSYEAIVFRAVLQAGSMSMNEVKGLPNSQIGFSKAKVNGWLNFDKSTGSVTPLVTEIDDAVQTDLKLILNQNADNVPDPRKQDLKKRKLIKEIIINSFLVSKGSSFSLTTSKLEAELTPEMIADDSWKNVSFKPYNFDALGIQPSRGHLHPLMKMRAEFRQIFLEMGFTEMPTNKFVESSFWNFDALFQPQQHPARDAHDTFFLTHPKECNTIPEDYMERVKEVHSKGCYGSKGYQYDWSISEARKNLLRTHTTATSAYMLKCLAKSGFKPTKLFSIDRVFRNETLDATHLAEFHQVEGVVADYNLSLGDMIGILHEFFKKLGIEKLKFKAAYNPYTEPSMEIFCYHPGLKKWIEVGNSGMFRPEMLLPMGLPKDVRVIAWGLSLERPTMIKCGLDNIRDLVGPRVQLQMVADNPICRLEKNSS
jgi:phenylalanyl-tRNA synthetase alpha chain